MLALILQYGNRITNEKRFEQLELIQKTSRGKWKPLAEIAPKRNSKNFDNLVRFD
jgi:hypothetical protein